MSSTRVLPQVIVEADGRQLAPEDVRALGEVRVQQRLSLPSQCELTLYDPPGPLSVEAALAPGTALRIRLPEHSEPLFAGEVTAVEQVYGPARERELHVRGYDLFHRLRKRQTVRAHVQVTLRELAQELVGDLGLSIQAAEPGPLWRCIFQHHRSDLELLVELAERCGLYLTLRGDVLHLLTLEGIGQPLPLVLGESLLEARVQVSGEPACRSVTASGWNPLEVEAYEGRASSARTGRNVSAEAPSAVVGGSGQRDLLHQIAQDVRHAEALAQAELDHHFAHEVTLWGIAEGNPLLRPGARVRVSGIADAFAGEYVLSAVTHTIDNRKGSISEFSTLPPAPRDRERCTIAAPGRVTRVDDPDELGRVRVSLPTYGDVETEWMHVLSAGAGEGKGLVVLPDVGDRVLVLLSHQDPGQGVVLGGLYGMDGPPDSGVEGNAVLRYTLLTPGGQRIQLDDAGKVIRLENSEGSYVELSPDRVRVHAATDLEIEAPGREIVIRGRSIDFERG